LFFFWDGGSTTVDDGTTAYRMPLCKYFFAGI